MKTLSAANQANIADRVQTPVIKIDLTNQSKKWSYGAVDGYDPIIISMSTITHSIDPYGGLGEYSDFSFSIQKEPSQIIQTDDLDNEPITVNVEYGSDGNIPVWSGVVDNWSYFKGTLTINCISKISIKGKSLPLQQINTTNYTTETIPDASLDKWVPFTIGTPYKPLGLAIDYGKNVSTAQVIFNQAISGHAAIGALQSDPAFYIWDQMKTWWKEGELGAGDQVGSSSLTAGRLDFDTLGTFNDIFLMLETDLQITRAEWLGGGSNAGNAIDGNTGTYAELSNPAGDGVTTGSEWRGLVPEFTGNTWDITAVYFIIKCEKENAINHGTRTSEKFHIAFEIITDTTPSLADQTQLLSGAGTSFNNVDGADSRLGKTLTLAEYNKAWGKNADTTDGFFPVDKLSRRWINIECIEEDPAGGGNESEYFRIHYVAVNPGVSIVFPVSLGIYGNLSGYDDDSSGTYTGTSNSLVETPCDVAYFIIDRMWGIGGHDTSSLSTARTAFGSYIIAGQILDLTGGEEILAGILSNSRSSVWIDYQDNWKYKYWSLPGSADKTFKQDTGDLAEEEIAYIGQSPSENVYNQFEILYQWSEAENRFKKVLLLDENSGGAIGTWLTDSQSDYNITRKMTFGARWINDDDTATSFGNYLIYRYADRKRVARWKTGFNGLEMELLDRVILDHQDITATDPTGESDPQFEIYSIETDLVNGIITFEGMQADTSHAALTDPT